MSQHPQNLFLHTSGPANAKILLIGEAWGSEEARLGKPFVGQSGQELNRMLAAAGLSRDEILFTNVIHAHPPDNEFTFFFHDSKAKVESFAGLKCKPELIASVQRLRQLIEIVKPQLIILAGNIPLWALFPEKVSISTKVGFKVPSGIMSWRGSELTYTFSNGATVAALPIIHPSAILRSWDLRHITVHDLRRAAMYLYGKKSSWGPFEVRAWHKPTFEQALRYLQLLETQLTTPFPLHIAADIETYRRRDMVCVGLSVDPDKLPSDVPNNICLPFFHFDQHGNYQPYFTISEELALLTLLRRIFHHHRTHIIGQNWNYDAYFFFTHLFSYLPPAFDTMLAQHVLFPGTRKSLDYLASLYLENYVYWKDESEDWNEPGAHETLWLYNCRDCEATRLIAKAQRPILASEKLTEQYDFLLESWDTAMRASLTGMPFDHTARSRVRLQLLERATWLQERLTVSVPEFARYSTTGKLWFNSPKATMDLFYGTLQLKPILHKKTKEPTVDATALPQIRAREPLLASLTLYLEELRSIEVFISHFLDVKLSPANRIHCSFNVGGTVTFRWSSAATPTGIGTNMQNLPKGDE